MLHGQKSTHHSSMSYHSSVLNINDGFGDATLARMMRFGGALTSFGLSFLGLGGLRGLGAGSCCKAGQLSSIRLRIGYSMPA